MERFREGNIKVFEKIISSGYNYEIQNGDNLDILCEKPENPCIVYFNHSAMEDPFVVTDLLHQKASERFNNFILPVSEYYVKFKNHFPYALIVRYGRALGISMPEIVQSYRNRDNISNHEQQQKTDLLNLKFKNLLNDKLDKGPVIVIAPEGHRSDDAKLQPAEAGVGLMVNIIQRSQNQGKIENGYFIPIGITYEKSGRGLHFNPANKETVNITIGKPLSAGEIIAESKLINSNSGSSRVKSHILMHHLAEILPQSLRGVYANEYYTDTLNGRFEMRMDKDGKVYVHDNKLM